MFFAKLFGRRYFGCVVFVFVVVVVVVVVVLVLVLVLVFVLVLVLVLVVHNLFFSVEVPESRTRCPLRRLMTKQIAMHVFVRKGDTRSA